MLRIIGRRVISNHGVRWRKVGEVIVEELANWDKIIGMEEGKKKIVFWSLRISKSCAHTHSPSRLLCTRDFK